jgi:hypothetical protein
VRFHLRQLDLSRHRFCTGHGDTRHS